DRRIIITQKPVFGKSYNVPRFVITFTEGGERMELGSSLKQGATQFSLPKSSLKIEEKGSKSFITFPIPDSALTRNQKVVIRTTHPQEFAKLIG
ncbi:MAG TPA: hypothetical protein VMW69_02045, partial [Spirochaetia bacterium]|nr:hypothetical protein [Spirochaetia bacterium]